MHTSKNKLDVFLSDPLLQELIDLNARTTNFLDIIDPRETQHTALMAWALNSREGHGQGDLVLKDFLFAIYEAATNQEAGDRLNGKGLTRDFVKKWTPTRVATTAFRSTIFIREYAIKHQPNNTNSNLRIDLLIIDPDNQFAIVVENKAGHKLTETQLGSYIASWKSEVWDRDVFREFLIAYVVIDKNFDEPLESDGSRPEKSQSPDGRWVMMNYNWLSRAADRTDRALASGDAKSALLNAYCRRMSYVEFSVEARKRETQIALSLVEEYPIIVDKLKALSGKSSNPKDWTNKTLDPEIEDGQIVRWLNQHPWLVPKLTMRPIDVFDYKLCVRIPKLASDNHWEIGRKHIWYDLDPTGTIPRTGHRWPLVLIVRYDDDANGNTSQFSVKFRWYPNGIDATENDLASISARYALVKGFRSYGGKTKGGENLLESGALDVCLDAADQFVTAVFAANDATK